VQRGVLQAEVMGQAPDERRKVLLEGASNEVKRIKEDNLTLVCSFCFKEEPMLRCSGCHGASYCAENCQDAHWAVHCPACDKLQASGHARLNDAASTNDRLPNGKHVAKGAASRSG